ncbi:MAG: beta-lactamase family protein, partial [Candidatus Latescibacterota bacterium]
MRKWIIATLISFIFAPAPSDGESSKVEQRIQRIENGLVAFTSPKDMIEPSMSDTVTTHPLAKRMTHYNIPGVSVAVIDHTNPGWARGYGVTRAGESQTVNQNTLFQAASTSKLIVSVITLRHVELGLIDLDEDVNTKLRS